MLTFVLVATVDDVIAPAAQIMAHTSSKNIDGSCPSHAGAQLGNGGAVVYFGYANDAGCCRTCNQKLDIDMVRFKARTQHAHAHGTRRIHVPRRTESRSSLLADCAHLNTPLLSGW